MWNGIVAMALPKQDGKKKLQLVCGNAIGEIRGKKKNFGNCGKSHCRKWEGKKEKKWFPKSEEELKKSATSTIFLQHFHNKSQVISYYQFKFEFNIEITFLI